MYEKHFHLRERPFALSPDPDYLYPSRVHQEALSYLRYGIEGHAGFVIITGEIGSGKTTMLQSVLGRLDQSTAVARIVNTLLDPRELLESIMLDFGMDPTGMSKPVLLHKLAAFLVQQRQAGRVTLLVIDEAQNLSLPALEEVRMLSNLETEKSKLLQIVLVGQPELRQTLAQPKLEQLRQRITVSYHLPPLDEEETANYINHRLKRAAAGAPLEFPQAVTVLIHRRSGGVPRNINVIADATLLFAYGVDRRAIDVSITSQAIAELDASGVLTAYSGGSPDAGIAAAWRAGDPGGGEAASPPQGSPIHAPVAAPTAAAVAPPAGVGISSTHRQATVRPNPPAPNRFLAPNSPPASTTPIARRHQVAPPFYQAGAPSDQGSIAPAYQATAAPAHQRSAVLARPRTEASAVAVMPNGVRVQRFTNVASHNPGLWDRLRRAVFGVFETGA
jgi:putative secretion ATPase (PEP-CTERM system associated)